MRIAATDQVRLILETPRPGVERQQMSLYQRVIQKLKEYQSCDSVPEMHLCREQQTRTQISRIAV